MKKRKRTIIKVILTIMIVYTALLLLLLISERIYGGSQINGLSSAIWYSIVTLSTVGYGDLVPVSPLGHLIGFIFLVMSMGILATVFSTVVSFITGEALPLIILSFNKEKNWYYFADFGEESRTLAYNILKEDESGVIIFGEKKHTQTEVPDYHCFFIDVPPSTVIARKNSKGQACNIFLMKENEVEFNSRSLNLHTHPVQVYARTNSGFDILSENIKFFHSYDCCARQYWQKKPIHFNERSIVIIGFGQYGKAILERAILTNVWSTSQHVIYHVFGDYKEFLQIHYRLNKVFSINKASDKQDSLIFHNESWTAHYQTLENADRIIICEDDVQKGWDIYSKLSNFYRLKGRIDLRSNRVTPGVSYFGTYEEIYTPQLIMKTQLNNAAVIINDLFQKSVHYPTVGWDQLDDFLRQSKIASADHLLTKVRILLNMENLNNLTSSELYQAYNKYSKMIEEEENLEKFRMIEHLRWCRFYCYYNWSYGPVRNKELKQHPMMRTYDELTSEQKLERDQSWQLMYSMAEEMARKEA